MADSQNRTIIEIDDDDELAESSSTSNPSLKDSSVNDQRKQQLLQLGFTQEDFDSITKSNIAEYERQIYERNSELESLYRRQLEIEETQRLNNKIEKSNRNIVKSLVNPYDKPFQETVIEKSFKCPENYFKFYPGNRNYTMKIKNLCRLNNRMFFVCNQCTTIEGYDKQIYTPLYYFAPKEFRNR